MNFKLLVIGIIVFCISCEKEKTTEPTNAPAQEAQPETTTSVNTTGLFVPITATRQEFLKAKKEYVEIADTANTFKTNDEIKLPIKGNRPPVVFKDSLQPKYDENIEQYHYKGRIDNPAFYLVQGDFWEWNDYYMINQYTGKKDTLWSDPIFSPDKNLIVNLSPAYGMEGDPNGIQLWKVANNNGNATLSKHKVIDQQEWIPLEVYWANNEYLIFRAVTVANFTKVNGEPQEKDVYYFKMRV